MMPEQTLIAKQHLDAQYNDISSLFTLMEKETTAIALRKSTHIDACAKEKVTLIQRIQQRDLLLAQSPELQQPSDELIRQIDAIKETLKKCHQLNEANGAALQRAHLSMHKLRNLFQEAGGNEEMTYDCDGKASGKRTLGTNFKV